MFIISKLMFPFGIINWIKDELHCLDRKMRLIMNASGCKNINSNTNQLYVDRGEGGRGLMNIEDTHNVSPP